VGLRVTRRLAVIAATLTLVGAGTSATFALAQDPAPPAPVTATPTPTPVDPAVVERAAREQAAAERAQRRAELRKKRAERRAKARSKRLRECSNRNQLTVINCIKQAAKRWKVSFAMLLRKARCESTLDPHAVGFGIHRGLFQFNYPGTWSTTPYRNHNPFSAKYNSLAAAWAHHVGRAGEWQCQ
jgi:hypothetical protein